MKQYEAYKDSGLDWLEEIPSHWDLQRTKRIVRLVTDNVSDHSLKKVALENIESWTGRFIETENEFAGDGVEFRQNDILFGKLRPYLAKVYKADFSGQSVGDIYVFRALDNNSSDFLKYLFISYPFISIVDGSTYGAKMPRANWDFISNLILPVPPIAEQEVIAAYLDLKVGQIDAILAEKEAMVEQLQQYRKSLISETVTRGLNPNVPMKDSGIDKFPIICSEWQTTKLKFVSSIKSGSSITFNNILSTGEYEVYGGNGLMGYANEYNVQGPAIIIGRVGALCGNIHLIESPKWVTDNALILTIRDRLQYEYLAYYLDAYNLNTLNASNAQPLITGTKVLEVIVPIPNIVEQKQIINFLKEKTDLIDASISELQSQIEDLKAYKSSVITEAVTGKVDLRDWKPSEVNA